MKTEKFRSVRISTPITQFISGICFIIGITISLINYRNCPEFHGSKRIFDEDNNFIQPFLSSSFNIAAQVLFSLGCIFKCLACLVQMVFIYRPVLDKKVLVLKLEAALYFTSGIIIFISIILFGASGEERNCMPDIYQNFLYWPFAFYVAGSLLDLGSGILFFVESRLAQCSVKDKNQQIFAVKQVLKA